MDNEPTSSPSIATDTRTAFEEFRVAGTTNPKELAASIASNVRVGKRVCLVAIGHQAVSQAVKAVPILNSHMANKLILFCILPSLEDRVIMEGKDAVTRTCTLLRLIPYSF